MASYRKRGDNWEYRIIYTDRRSGKRKEKSKGGFATKREAVLAAASEELEIESHGFAENGNEFAKNYFTEWLELKKPNVKLSTYSSMERAMRLHIIPEWGNYRLKDINRMEYQKWINRLKKEYSEGTIRYIHSIASSAMSDAVFEYSIIRENTIQRIRIPKDNKKKNAILWFSLDDVERLLKAVESPRVIPSYPHSTQNRTLILLLARTGLRIGEALALTWDDLEGDSITVNKTVVFPVKADPYTTTPKTKSSNRTIKLDSRMVTVLKQYRINQKEVILRYPGYRTSKDNLIFHRPDGAFMRSNVFRAYFKTVCKDAKAPLLPPHALRHSHAVHLLEAGASIKAVSDRLGHASIKVTADTYMHITKKIENSTIDLFEAYANS